MTSPRMKKPILVAVFLLLLTAFGLQVQDSLVKFFGGKMTTATWYQDEDALEFPTIALCPGYKYVIRVIFFYSLVSSNYFSGNK